MKLSILPETMGYVFIRPIKINKIGGIVLPESKGRLEAKLAIVESEGDLNGKLVMYAYGKRKEVIFCQKQLLFIRIADIIATVEIEDGMIVDDELNMDINRDFSTYGEPEIIKG